MSNISIQKIGITKLHTDAIVNAANEGLWEGGGVCGAIFREAGSKELTRACKAIGGCKTGEAVITSGFQLPAKYVIHAVGPRWFGGTHDEPKLLYSAYKQSLLLAQENDLHSIGFPLISAGIFGYPVDKAWTKAIQACHDFLTANPDYEMDIVFAVLDDEILQLGKECLEKEHSKTQIADSVIAEDECQVDVEILRKAQAWCTRYEILFRVTYEDEDLRNILKRYSVYSQPQGHMGLYPILRECMKQAYREGVVVTNYGEIIEAGNLSDRDVMSPTDEWAKGLTATQILACIAWHFRRDHFVEGSWISDSVAGGRMLTLVRAFLQKDL